MPGLFRRFANFTQLRKRTSENRTHDVVPQLPLPVPVPNDPMSGAGGAHLDAPQQPLDGDVDTTVESAVDVVAQITTLEELPAELRYHILAHVAADLRSLRALTLASPVFYQQYLLDRKALLCAGLKMALGNSLVDAYVVQTSASLYDRDEPADSRHEPPDIELETIKLVIDNYVALRSATPDVIIEECCTEEDLLGMAAFYHSVARPLISSEFPTRFVKRLDPSLEVANNISAAELSRLSRAVYRYQFYCNLFGSGPDGDEREVPEIELGWDLDHFFCIFTPWEIEEIYCIYTLFKAAYSDILDVVARHFAIGKPKFHTYQPNPFLPASWDLAIPAIRESLIRGTSMRGLLPFYHFVRANDDEELADKMDYYVVHGGNAPGPELALSWTNQSSRRQRYPLEGDQLEASRARLRFSGDTEDGPPLAWVIYWRGRYSNRYGAAIPASLQSWGHVFWDRKRLIRSKGTEEVLRERGHLDGH